MANTKKIKAQIKSVSNIQQITKALEVVATVKLQKVKHQTEQYRDFMIEFMRIVQVLNQKTNIYNTSEGFDTGRKLVVVMGTDKGLCGSLNAKLFKEVFTKYDNQKENVDVFCIGKKTLEFFSRSNFNVVWQVSIKDEFEEDDLQGLYMFIRDAFEKRQYDEIVMYYNYFKNAISQVPLCANLYPLNKESFDTFSKEIGIDLNSFNTKEMENKDLLLEPTPEELAKEMRKQLLQHMLYGAVLQNKAGEFASRMIAMKNAKDNSTSLIRDLKLSFNKARQSVITQEISEIVWAKMALDD